jgi:hypothetical protein
VPVIVGIELAVAYLLATKTCGLGEKTWQLLLMIILLFGLSSCFIYLKADTWWTLRYGYHVKRIAPIINNSKDPLVVTRFESQILAFPHHLNPDVKLISVGNIDKLNVAGLKGDVFLYDIDKKEMEQLNNTKGYRVVGVNPDDRLWKLEKLK